MTTNENPAAVRVCAIADIECSRGCGTGPCKREAESSQPAAAPIARNDPAAVTRLKAICRKLGLESAFPDEVYSNPEGLFAIFGQIRSAIDRLARSAPSPIVLHALRAAKQFIANGVELGYIRMPDSDCPDPAHEVPNLIDAAISSLSTAPSPADERAAFEAWAREEPFDLSMFGSIYTNSETCAAWHGWRTRAESASATGAEGADALAHEVWSAAQRAPGEGIEDAVQRIAAILSRSPAMAAEAVPFEVTEQAAAEWASRHDVDHVLKHFSTQRNAIEDARTLHLLAAAPQHAQADARVGLTDEQILGLNAGEVFFSESPTKYPEAGHGTQYHAGAPGVLGFARAAIALAAQPGQPEPRAEVTEEQPSLTNPLTPYGMLVRALRIVSGTLLYDMAKSMSLSPATLSAIEVGRRPATYAEACGAADFFASRGIPGTLQALECAIDAARAGASS